MTDDPKCVAGCISFYGGERKHHKDCPYYAESLTKLNADRIEALEAENARLRESLAEHSMPCTCHEAYSGRKMQDPECRAGEYGDYCREAIGLPPLCQYNLRMKGDSHDQD